VCVMWWGVQYDEMMKVQYNTAVFIQQLLNRTTGRRP
jgi:hypothetical protein